ncbi:MAG: hypothetical protein WAV50_02935 [Minisyncoccia bacterium]
MHLSSGKGEFASPQYQQPCTTVLIEEMVAEINEDIDILPRILEITMEKSPDGYDQVEEGELDEIYLAGTDLYLLGPRLAISPIDIWHLELFSVTRFPNGSFFFSANGYNCTIRTL